MVFLAKRGSFVAFSLISTIFIYGCNSGPDDESKADEANPVFNGKDGKNGAQGQTGATGERGEKGDRGEMGPMGLTGPTGPAGATGPTGPMGATGAMGPQGPSGIRQMTKQVFLNHFLNPTGTPNPVRGLAGGFYLGSYINPTGHNIQITGSIMIGGGSLAGSGTCSSWTLGIQGQSKFVYTESNRMIFEHYTRMNNQTIITIPVNVFLGPGGSLDLFIPPAATSTMGGTSISMNPSTCITPTNYNSFITLRAFNLTKFVDPNPTTPPLVGPFADP